MNKVRVLIALGIIAFGSLVKPRTGNAESNQGCYLCAYECPLDLWSFCWENGCYNATGQGQDCIDNPCQDAEMNWYPVIVDCGLAS